MQKYFYSTETKARLSKAFGDSRTKDGAVVPRFPTSAEREYIKTVSRGILMYAMRTLSHCKICGHVHDELIIECGRDVSVSAICEQMGRTPPWMPGLLLRADGYGCSFYRKD